MKILGKVFLVQAESFHELALVKFETFNVIGGKFSWIFLQKIGDGSFWFFNLKSSISDVTKKLGFLVGETLFSTFW